MDDFLDWFLVSWGVLEANLGSAMFESELSPEIRTKEFVLTDWASLDEEGIFF